MQAATLCGHVIQDGCNVNKVYNKPMQNIGAEVLLWHPGNVLSLGLAETKGLQKSASWWHYNSRSSQHFFFFTLIFHRPAGRKCSRTILVMHFVQQQFHGPPAVPPDPLGVVDPLLRTGVSHQILGPGYKDSGGCYL